MHPAQPDPELWAHLDAEGNVLGFYCPEVHDTIPEGAVRVDKAQHEELCHYGKERQFRNGQVLRTQHPVATYQARRRVDVDSETDRLLPIGPTIQVGTKGAVSGADALINSASSGRPTDWIAEDNSIISLTAAELRVCADAVVDYRTAVVMAGRTHKNAINALLTQEEVESYDISTGWPESTITAN
jgi:hypothetical protein